MKKIFRKEVLIGLIVLFSFAVLIIGIDFLKGVNVFKAANYYYISYENVEGLAVSAPVTINGYKIGQVRDIAFDYDHPDKVYVEVSLNKDLKVPVGSEAVLGSDLLGTATISLKLASPGGAYYTVGDTIPAAQSKGLMANVSDNLVPSVEKIFPKIDTLLSNLNKITGDEALIKSVRRLDAITANLEATTRKINSTIGALQPVVSDVRNITANVSTISSDMTSFSNTVKNLPVDSIASELQATLANLKELSETLNNPNSSLGRLTSDPALYDNLNSTISSLDSLFVDIKRNPKRYISIKLL